MPELKPSFSIDVLPNPVYHKVTNQGGMMSIAIVKSRRPFWKVKFNTKKCEMNFRKETLWTSLKMSSPSPQIRELWGSCISFSVSKFASQCRRLLLSLEFSTGKVWNSSIIAIWKLPPSRSHAPLVEVPCGAASRNPWGQNQNPEFRAFIDPYDQNL